MDEHEVTLRGQASCEGVYVLSTRFGTRPVPLVAFSWFSGWVAIQATKS